MSSLLESIMGQLGGQAAGRLAGQLGADETRTRNGIAAALPLLLNGLARNSRNAGGADALGAALDRDHDGSVLDDLTGFLGRGDTSAGAGILGHVFGGRRETVEKGLGRGTGLDGAQAGKLMAMLAPVVLGALGKAKRQSNLDASGLSDMLGRERQAVAKKAPKQMGVLDALLDADGDGDVDLNDIAKLGSSKGGGLLGKLFGSN